MRIALIAVGLSSLAAIAAGPATRPSPPNTRVGPREMPTVIDTRKPTFVPKFAQVNNPPAGQFEERNYAYRYGYPTPFVYGCYAGWAYGCYGIGYGYGAGDYGSTSVSFR